MRKFYRYLFSVLILIFAISMLSAVKVKDLTTVNDLLKEDLDSVTNVNFEGNFEIKLNQGVKNSISIQGPKNYKEGLFVKISKNTLFIESDEKKLKREIKSAKFIIDITLTQINSINLTGVIGLTNNQPIKGEFLKISMEGIGSCELSNLLFKKVNASLEGATYMKLEGKALDARYDLQGIGYLDAENLRAHDVIANNDGVGKISLYADNVLIADQQGIGAIIYSGSPKKIKKNVDGIGAISEKD